MMSQASKVLDLPASLGFGVAFSCVTAANLTLYLHPQRLHTTTTTGNRLPTEQHPDCHESNKDRDEKKRQKESTHH
jgi:hypothetical protein|tara:strand:- start:577 stop:804 length:228 start_codon:yes stop_codon:yes gene_type:complete